MKMVFSGQCNVFRLVLTEDQLPLFEKFAKEWQLYSHEDQYYFEFQRSEFGVAVKLLQSMQFGDDGSLEAVLGVIQRLQNPRPFLKLV